jgi:hypothetical protein
MGQVTNTDLELSLVIDVSGSVDASEYALQLGGYAAAFNNPAIQSAIGAGTNGSIAVNTIFFDSGFYSGIDWTLLSTAADATAFADALNAVPRPGSGGTNPAAGINAATTAITGNTYEGTRKVIDVSGDGTGNSGSDIAARDAALAAGIDAINGLPINLSPGDTSIEDYYSANIVGGQGSFTEAAEDFSDFERAILAKLRREILGEIPDERLLFAGLRPIAIALSRTMSRDVGGRLMRLRAGGPGDLETTTTAPVVGGGGSKDGMAKGGMAKEVIPGTTTVVDRWHVWGDVYYFNQDFDGQTSRNANGASVLVTADSELDIFGGSVGVDYRLNQNFTLGIALGAASGDADIKGVADVDIDSIAIMPYLSYYRSNAIGGADLWADLLYSYTDTDYDVEIGGVDMDLDGKSHQVEFNVGLNYQSGNLIHGPFAQLRYTDGEVDSGADFDSFATQLGYQVSNPMSVGNGTLIPQARVAWEHEFEADQGSLGGFSLGEIDEDLFVGGLGLIYAMNNGWDFGADYEARLGDQSESHYIGLKAGFTF